MNNQEKKLLNRRDVIKAGGLLALGLAYTKPMVETVLAKPAFDAYDPNEPPPPPGSNGQNCKGKCPDNYTGPEWDCSSIMVTVGCSNGIANFMIKNVGSGNMGGTLPYTIYQMQGPNVTGVLSSGSFGPLASGAFVIIPADYCGKIRLVAQQHPCHPGGSQPQADTTCRPCG